MVKLNDFLKDVEFEISGKIEKIENSINAKGGIDTAMKPLNFDQFVDVMASYMYYCEVVSSLGEVIKTFDQVECDFGGWYVKYR